MILSAYQASYNVTCEALRKVLRDAGQVDAGQVDSVSGVPWRFCAALYSLLLDHPVDHRGRCRSCRRPGAVLGFRRRRCQVHRLAYFYLRESSDFLRSHVARELDTPDQSRKAPAVPPSGPPSGGRKGGRPASDHGGAGERPDRPRSRRGPRPDAPPSAVCSHTAPRAALGSCLTLPYCPDCLRGVTTPGPGRCQRRLHRPGLLTRLATRRPWASSPSPELPDITLPFPRAASVMTGPSARRDQPPRMVWFRRAPPSPVHPISPPLTGLPRLCQADQGGRCLGGELQRKPIRPHPASRPGPSNLTS
jgi:hypothetical protein